MNPPSAPSAPSQGPGGQGFKGSIFNVPQAGGQDNSQKTTQAGGANGGIFGMGASSQQPQNPFAFSSAAASSNNAFATSTAPASGNVFGQTTGNNTANQPASKPNILGASQVSEQASKGAGDAMQTSPEGAGNTSRPGMFNLPGAGQASPSPTPGASSLQSPKFTFGSTSQLGAPSSSAAASQAPTTAPTTGFKFPSATSGGAPLFGATTKSEAPKFGSGIATSGITAPSTPGGTSLFGRTNKPDEGTASSAAAATSASPAPSVFSSTPAFSAGGNTNTLFSAPSKPQETPSATTPAPFTAAATAASSTPSMFASKPAFPAGGNTSTLFGAASKPQETPSATTSASAPSQSVFGSTSGFAPSPKTSTLFGSTSLPKDTSTAPAAPAVPATTPSKSPSPSLFGAPAQPPATGGSVFDRAAKPQEGPTASTQSNTEAKSAFAPPTPATTSTSTPIFKPPASAAGQLFPPSASGSNLFGAPKPTEAAPTDNVSKEKDSGAEAKPLFGGASQNQSKPPESTMFAPPKASSAADKERPPMFPASTPQTQSSLAKPVAQDAAKSTASGTQTEMTTAAQKPKYVDEQTQTTFKAKSNWASLLPPSIPVGLKTEEERENYTRTWRLTMLNKSFQSQVAAINPEKQDIDNVVAFYVMLRTQIGMPTELTTLLKPVRPDTPDAFPPKDISPLKRKADTTDDSATQKRRRPSQSESTDNATPNAIAQPAAAYSSSSSAMKRKAPDDKETDDGQTKSGQTGKRAKVNEQTNGTTPSSGVETQDSQKNDATTADKDKDGEDTGTVDESQAPKASVSDTLQKFASSFVSQKGPSGATTSESQSDSESSDEDENEAQDETQETTGKSDDKPNGTNTSTSASPPSDGGRSLFDRVQKDDTGKPVRHIEAEEKASKEDQTETNKDAEVVPSLFAGSKFASSLSASSAASPQFSFAGSSGDSRTPSPGEKNAESTKPSSSTSIFAGLTPTDAPANFSPSPAPSPAPTSAPAASTPAGTAGATSNAPSPSSSIFANMAPQAPTITFGSSPSTSAPTPPPSNTNTLFNTGIEQPKPLAPGQLGGASLSPFAASGASSTDPSRSNTPAQSDTAADNESEEAAEKLPQTDLTRGGVGEEEEDTLFESRARGLKMQNGSWEVQGTGLIRILKHRATGRARVLLRADPSGKVVLNSLLNAQIEYASNGKAVTFPVFAEDAAPEKWAVRVKTEKDARELGTTMQDNKKGA